MEISELDKINIFFILGRPRSGTTLLRTLFDAHSNVSIPFEGRIISDLYLKYGRYKLWNENLLLKFYKDIFIVNKIDGWEFNPNLKKDILELGNNANFERLIKTIYINTISLFEKDKIILIGDKNPFYSIRKSYLKIFKKAFPNAKIIHLVRDYRAHYNSMTKMDFENTHIGIVANRWVFSNKIINSVYGNYRNYLLLKHEDLTKNSVEVLTNLCNFLGIEFQPKMLEFYKIKDIVLQKYGEEILKVHSSLLNPVTDKFNDKWKTSLTKKQIIYLDKIVGVNAEKVGYDRCNYSKSKVMFNCFFIFYNYIYLVYAKFIDYLPINIKQKVIKFPSIFLKRNKN